MPQGTPEQDLPDGYLLDEEMTASMARAAAIFREGMRSEGIALDYTPSSVVRLDEIAEQYVQTRPDAAGVHAFAVTMGAYLGEVVVRARAGRWVTRAARESVNQEPVGLQLASGLLAFPLTKANKRLTVGPEHNLRQFIDVAMSGVLPPDARPVSR